MAAVAGTGTSLSASYYLRNFYTANRNAVTSSKRKEMTGGTLSQADATALHRAAKKLRNFNYEDDSSSCFVHQSFFYKVRSILLPSVSLSTTLSAFSAIFLE